MKWNILFIALFASVFVACGTQPLPDAGPPSAAGTAQPQSNIPTPGLAQIGQDGTYLQYGVYQPLDMYTITGEVMAAPGSVVQGHIEGGSYSYNGTGSGYISGGTTGKTIVRLHVTQTVTITNAYVEKGLVQRDENWKPLAKKGDYIILKIEDTRGTGFVPGDTVELKCREQWELVGAVGIGEVPFLRNISREFDLCRMSDGHYIPAPTATSVITP